MNRGVVDFESLDETALLSLAILLEEMSAHVLGETGDLAFVEGEEDEELSDGDSLPSGPQASAREESTQSTASDSESTVSATESSSGGERRPKRQKTTHDDRDDSV